MRAIKIDLNEYGYSTTLCPYLWDSTDKVYAGSLVCNRRCKFHLRNDYPNRVVYCSFDEVIKAINTTPARDGGIPQVKGIWIEKDG